MNSSNSPVRLPLVAIPEEEYLNLLKRLSIVEQQILADKPIKKLYYSTSEVAHMLGKSRQVVITMVEYGVLKPKQYYPGADYLFPKEHTDQVLAA